MGDTVINNIKYADDTVIVKSENQLQQLMYTVVEENEANGLFLNSSKSFNMIFLKSDVISTCKTTLHDNRLDQVNKFVYPVILFTSYGRFEKDVQRRITIAKSPFSSLEKVHQLPIKT